MHDQRSNVGRRGIEDPPRNFRLYSASSPAAIYRYDSRLLQPFSLHIIVEFLDKWNQ